MDQEIATRQFDNRHAGINGESEQAERLLEGPQVLSYLVEHRGNRISPLSPGLPQQAKAAKRGGSPRVSVDPLPSRFIKPVYRGGFFEALLNELSRTSLKLH